MASVEQIFTQVLDIFGRPSRRFYELLTMLATDRGRADPPGVYGHQRKPRKELGGTPDPPPTTQGGGEEQLTPLGPQQF